MAKKPKVEEKVPDKATVSKITRTVSKHEGFHFYKDMGDSTGKFATSLADFAEKLRIVDVRSVNFHFKRRDFEKWIRDVLGDSELSRRVSRIHKEAHGEKLRSEIVQIVRARLGELEGAQTAT